MASLCLNSTGNSSDSEEDVVVKTQPQRANKVVGRDVILEEEPVVFEVNGREIQGRQHLRNCACEFIISGHSLGHCQNQLGKVLAQLLGPHWHKGILCSSWMRSLCRDSDKD